MRILSVLWRWASSLATRTIAGTWRATPTSGTGCRQHVIRSNRHVIGCRMARTAHCVRRNRTVFVRFAGGTSMKYEIKDSKTVAEKLDYVIDLTEELQKRGQSGEDDTIYSVTWTVPSTMTASGAFYSDFACGVFLAAGVAGRNNVDAAITTVAGRIYDVRLVLTIKNNT